jgi:hypothetical protein
MTAMLIGASGCVGGIKEYSNTWLYPDDVKTVYVEMFDSESFRRNHEVTLTDAICKNIEAKTPYKIVSNRDTADTLLSGTIGGISSGILATDRETGGTIQREASATVVVSWQNLETGDMLIDRETTTGIATYSSKLGQNFDYAANAAVNKVAVKVVELMETKW